VDALARRIYDSAHLEGAFRLRSGAVSGEYFDKYLFESDPALLRAVAEALTSLLPHDAEAVAGLELGGVPLATMVSQLSGLHACSSARWRRTTGRAAWRRAARSRAAGWR
jgi:orotate phosphoribosyltransferase